MDWQSIADHLIDEGLLVTAFELHGELNERGKKIQSLEEFFRDSKHLKPRSRIDLPPESSSPSCASFSQITLDDISRYSEDSRTRNHDRVAVLEFELRRANETIDSLRKELTESVLHSKSSSHKIDLKNEQDLREARKSSKASQEEVFVESTSDGLNEEDDEEEIEIRGHEQKILNYLVNEYLLQRRYKLTAITFSDENSEEDFEDWDSIGLNISKPPNLLTLFRKYNRYALKYKKDNRNKECQTDENILQHIIHDTMNKCSMEMTKMKEDKQKQLIALEKQETELITVNCLLEEYKYRVSELESQLNVLQK